jgi:hypothetical protein
MRQYPGNGTYPPNIGLIDDSDAPNASNFDVAPQGLADRTSYLFTTLSNEITARNALQAHFNQLLNKPFLQTITARTISTVDGATAWTSNAAFQTATSTGFTPISAACSNLLYFAGLGPGRIAVTAGDTVQVIVSSTVTSNADNGGLPLLGLALMSIIDGGSPVPMLETALWTNGGVDGGGDALDPFTLVGRFVVTSGSTLDFAIGMATSTANNLNISLLGAAQIMAFPYRIQT